MHGRASTIFLNDFNSPDFTIKHNTDYAYFDEDFWFLLQDNNAREKIKEVLIKMITND